MPIPLRVILILCSLIVVASCTSEAPAPSPEADGWGPLAVIESDGSGLAPLVENSGPLSISDRCVAMSSLEGEPVQTLVWLSGLTSWDATNQEILFEDPRRGEMKFRDGDEVSVGGSGVNGAGPDLPWLAEPHDSCPDEVFLVHSAEDPRD